MDLLSSFYLWIKAFHIIAVICWMAGIFYLPRLYVYHAERVQQGIPQAEEMFQVMERRLLRGIMLPAMLFTWIFGLLLVLTPGIVDWSEIWPWTKASSVIVMTWFHMWLARRRKDFVAATNQTTGRTFRMMNEIPTLLLVVIVLSVVLKF
jgi:putative membrane protein